MENFVCLARIENRVTSGRNEVTYDFKGKPEPNNLMVCQRFWPTSDGNGTLEVYPRCLFMLVLTEQFLHPSLQFLYLARSLAVQLRFDVPDLIHPFHFQQCLSFTIPPLHLAVRLFLLLLLSPRHT
ncbi:hypothetical protein SEVIR_7G286602v4 [Setaria viridis]